MDLVPFYSVRSLESVTWNFAVLLNAHQEAILNELKRLEDATTQSHALDYLITELEIRTAANKLKNNKSSYSDRIKNEMIKSSLNELMPIYLQLVNAVLKWGTMPQTWCDDLITPIFKSGTKSDPSDYCGSWISSCLGKLFCSLLNQRFLEYIQSRDILHKSQILGFLPNNLTADHVLTLRALIDKLSKLSQNESIQPLKSIVMDKRPKWNC